MIPAFALGLCLLQNPTINLYRGADIGKPRYWDVSDTFLDSSTPDTPNGGSYTLLGGKGKVILIRFGDLNRVIGPHKHITKATLYLSPSGGDVPIFKSASRVLQSWEEGPRTVIMSILTPQSATAKAEVPRWATTYRQRHAGFEAWGAAGASGPQDTEAIPDATMDTTGTEIAIHGLETTVQRMLDQPGQNHGLALQFTSNSEFLSSKSPNGRPRLEIETIEADPTPGPDLSVTRIEKSGDTYTAHIKNVGDQPAPSFSIQWSVSGQLEKPLTVDTSLKPGDETTPTFTYNFPASKTDHRVHPLTLKVIPNGPDACAANNELTINADAIPIDVTVTPEAAQRLMSGNYLGSKGLEDWVQSQIQLWNDTYADKSRFSFAPDGALERLRLNSIQISADASTGMAVVNGDVDPMHASLPFLRQLGQAAGLLNGDLMQITQGSVNIQGSTSRASTDLFPGLMGYGDTRFEGMLPGAIPMFYDPATDPAHQGADLEATDLLCGNDVAALNAHLESKPAKRSDDLLPIKKAIILQVLDLTGQPVKSADLLFFQSTQGKFMGGDPAFAVRTNDNGIAILNTRGAAGPFGDLDQNAGNGTFLIQAKANGVLETGWLKAWQLNEESIRNATTFPIHLDLPDAPIETDTNLALDRLIADSAQDLPTKLSTLIDDNNDTTAALPSGKDSWVEIDLGRDRTIGEIDLVTKGDPMWRQFDVMVYGTGQRPEDAYSWIRELDWNWTVKNRSDATNGAKTVAYRGSSQRVRYIRLVNRSGDPGSLAEIRIFGARATP
jgi:hypothetical protein